MADRDRIPAALLAGLVGAGRTTLLERSFRERRGPRSPVIAQPILADDELRSGLRLDGSP